MRLRDVVHLLVHHHPQRLLRVVLGYLLHGQEWLHKAPLAALAGGTVQRPRNASARAAWNNHRLPALRAVRRRGGPRAARWAEWTRTIAIHTFGCTRTRSGATVRLGAPGGDAGVSVAMLRRLLGGLAGRSVNKKSDWPLGFPRCTHRRYKHSVEGARTRCLRVRALGGAARRSAAHLMTRIRPVQLSGGNTVRTHVLNDLSDAIRLAMRAHAGLRALLTPVPCSDARRTRRCVSCSSAPR